MLRYHWNVLPRLIRFMLSHFANGVVLGWSCGLFVIWSNFGDVGTLLARNDSAVFTAMFFAGGGLLFGTLVMSVAVMNLGMEDD